MRGLKEIHITQEKKGPPRFGVITLLRPKENEEPTPFVNKSRGEETQIILIRNRCKNPAQRAPPESPFLLRGRRPCPNRRALGLEIGKEKYHRIHCRCVSPGAQRVEASSRKVGLYPAGPPHLGEECSPLSKRGGGGSRLGERRRRENFSISP